MANALGIFESIVRKANTLTDGRSSPLGGLHPFDDRNIHPKIQAASQKLFDDGYYSQATFEAYKLVDKEVQKNSGLRESGVKLMMKAFNETSPLVQFNDLSSISERDEQEGYKFLFSGSVLAIRNPRGHEIGVKDSLLECLDHLSLASLLLRKLESKSSVRTDQA